MKLLSAEEIATARSLVAAVQAPTPTLRWPLLDTRLGARAWVKHENHSRVGAFKLRGGAGRKVRAPVALAAIGRSPTPGVSAATP